MTSLNQQILSVISDISFANGQKLVNLISEIVIKGNNIGFSIETAGFDLSESETVRKTAIEKIRKIPEIDKITIIFTQNRSAVGTVDYDKKENKAKPKYLIDNVKNVIIVTAGKGGVGKSTISAMIAERLNTLGHKVGIVDADIYGPSIPQIFGIEELPKIKNNKMIPLLSRNIKLISIGFLNQNVIAWRGPMLSKAIYQLLSLTDWVDLDYLIIDSPPGTGDIHLSILENYQINGTVIVTTPQKISQIDVKKSIDLYRKFNVPILGIIENMSYFLDANGNKIEIFAGSSASSLSKQYSIPLICEIPLLPALSLACDKAQSLSTLAERIPIEQFLPPK